MAGTAHTFEDRIIISGVGLIGGSIAAAVRKRFPTCEVIGVGRSAQRLQAAQEMGLLTSWSTEYSADLFNIFFWLEKLIQLLAMIGERAVASIVSDFKKLIVNAASQPLNPNSVTKLFIYFSARYAYLACSLK